MKKAIVLMWIGLFAIACSTNKKEKAEALFNDPVMQDEIFNAIIADTSRLHNFFDKLHKQHVQQGGRMHTRMMQKMCCDVATDSTMMCSLNNRDHMMRHMLRQTDQDTMFCRQMGDSVMGHHRLKKHLMQRMEPGRQKRGGQKN